MPGLFSSVDDENTWNFRMSAHFLLLRILWRQCLGQARAIVKGGSTKPGRTRTFLREEAISGTRRG